MPTHRALVPHSEMLPNQVLFESSVRPNPHPPYAPRFYRFAYPMPGRRGRDVLPHHLRDADAALFLHAPLADRGFTYAGPIINYPCERADAPDDVVFDDSFLRSSDLLVLTTRPPLDDEEDAVKCRVLRSHTTLETKVFSCLRQVLPRCSRSRLIVSDVQARASAGVAQFRIVEFQQRRGAPISRFQPLGNHGWQRPPAGAQSLAYLIYAEHAWPDGPALLASFGMCGTNTLIWNYFLAQRFPQLICAAPFAMAQLEPPPRAKGPSPSHDPAHGWKVGLLTADADL